MLAAYVMVAQQLTLNPDLEVMSLAPKLLVKFPRQQNLGPSGLFHRGTQMTNKGGMEGEPFHILKMDPV